jgi:hypothetical protein
MATPSPTPVRLPPPLVLEIALATGTCPRSVLKAVSGGRVTRSAGYRIEEELRRRGLLALASTPTRTA